MAKKPKHVENDKWLEHYRKSKQPKAKTKTQKELTALNNWLRKELEKQGVSKEVSKELRKGFRDAFRRTMKNGTVGNVSVGRMSRKTVRATGIRYVQAKAAKKLSRITYKDLSQILMHDIAHSSDDENYNYYYLLQDAGVNADVFDDDDLWNSEISTDELQRIISKIKDRNPGKKQTRALRQALKYFIANKRKEGGIKNIDDEELLLKIASPSYTDARTRNKLKEEHKAQVKAEREYQKAVDKAIEEVQNELNKELSMEQADRTAKTLSDRARANAKKTTKKGKGLYYKTNK